ncbi:CRAL-TRIO domain-containing protein [Gloeopeniophorella convolvens]|nr:CRAL-TRIO domain-containing protein [Gloeopeniophorella convolvens]
MSGTTASAPTATTTAPKPQPAPVPAAAPRTAAPSATKPASPAPAPKAVAEPPASATTDDDDDTADEPQNALTQKFTKEEWAALQAFRPLLPEILDTAYDGREGARTTPIVVWGVTLDPAPGAKDARASVELNVAEAKTMMVATLRWRDEFKVEEAMKATYPELLDGFGHLYGHDKDGRPVMYNIYGGKNDLKAAFSDVQLFIRWRVALMEHGIKLIDFETVDQMVQVHDYEGVGLSSRTANSKQAASELASIFQSHYPEFLASKFFVNVPSIMTWMKVVGHGPRTIGRELLPLIDVKQLPAQYGGAVQDAW